jgi:hypothetical protein
MLVKIVAAKNRLEIIRRLFIEEIEAHESICPHGDLCAERVNLIAFLCHAVGISPELAAVELPKLIGEYDARCPTHGMGPFSKS